MGSFASLRMTAGLRGDDSEAGALSSDPASEDEGGPGRSGYHLAPMREVLRRLEVGDTLVPRAELESALSPDDLAALRSASIVRDTEDPETLELSLSDSIRALRVLYGAEGRGIVAWSAIQPTPMAVGIATDACGPRDVALVSGACHGFEIIAMRHGRTLALTFTADHLTRARRHACCPGARVEIEVLEESLFAEHGKLARRATPVPVHVPTPVIVPAPAPPPPPAPDPALASGPKYPGATSWSEVRITADSWALVRIQHGPHVSRATAVDLDMAHAASRKPTVLWHALHIVCGGQGTFRSRTLGNAKATKKTLSRLGLALRDLFGLDESPFHPYVRGTGWVARFVADDQVDEDVKRLSDEQKQAIRERLELDEELNDYQRDAGGKNVDEDGPVKAARKYITRP